MARKKKEAAESADTKKVQFVVSFPKEVVELMDLYATVFGWTRSEFISVCAKEFANAHSDEFNEKLKRLTASLSK